MIKFEHVTISNPWMWLAYLIAKDFYKIHLWNKKTIPVAVLISATGEYISHGICSNGMHAVLGHCNRIEEKGTPYHLCEHCATDQHAEVKAIENASFRFSGLNILPTKDATMYIYGHYKTCDSCYTLLEMAGIKKVVFLENAEVLFDRHNPNTVIGTAKQFML